MNRTHNTKIALFDMDGTLADFVKGMEVAMRPLQSTDEQWDYDNYSQDQEPSYMRARRRLVKQQPGFWRELPAYEPGFTLLYMALEIGFHITVFTKVPLGQPQAAAEKIEWCKRHLDPIIGAGNYDMAQVSNKGFTYGRLLVDDWPAYIEPWLQHRPRGQVIMPAHAYNTHYKREGQVLRFATENLGDLAAARQVMMQAFTRNGDQ